MLDQKIVINTGLTVGVAANSGDTSEDKFEAEGAQEFVEGGGIRQGRHSGSVRLHFHLLESRSQHQSLLVLPFIYKRRFILRRSMKGLLVFEQVFLHKQLTCLQTLLKLQTIDGAVWKFLLHLLERKVFGKLIYDITDELRVAGTFLNLQFV